MEEIITGKRAKEEFEEYLLNSRKKECYCFECGAIIEIPVIGIFEKNTIRNEIEQDILVQEFFCSEYCANKFGN